MTEPKPLRTLGDKTEHALFLILGARWLGHGRATECLLTCIALTYGTALTLWTSPGWESSALIQLAWQGRDHLVGYALLLKAALSGFGLIANIRGWMGSRYFRFFGAFIGSAIWVWFARQYWAVGQPILLSSIVCMWFFLFSVRIMGLALANRPLPGVPGQL